MKGKGKRAAIAGGILVVLGGTGAAQEGGSAKPASEMRRAIEWKQFEYTCEGGAKLTVYLHNETVKVGYKDKTYLMKQVMAGSGTRYSDGKTVWWSKGNGGFLQEDAADGNGAMIVKGCELNTPLNASGTGTITGTVTYLQRMALPPTAVIEVELRDVSKADAAAEVVAKESLTAGERQVPIAFTLPYDPGKIEASHRYSVGARILVDGKLRYASDQAYPVLTKGNPAKAELVLKAVQP